MIYDTGRLSCGWSFGIESFHLPRILLKKEMTAFLAQSVKQKLSNKTSRPHVLSLIACGSLIFCAKLLRCFFQAIWKRF